MANGRRRSNHATMVPPLLLILQQVNAHQKEMRSKGQNDFSLFLLPNCFFFFFVSVGLQGDRGDMYPGGYSILSWPGYSSITRRCEPSVPESTRSCEHNTPPSTKLSEPFCRQVSAQLLETPSLICPSCYRIRLHTLKQTH